MALTRGLREPMLWFFVAGGILFAVAPRHDRESANEVHLDRRNVASLAEGEARRRHLRTLPSAIATAVREQAIDDELLYREGLRLGVDKNDNIIRQRVIEKMLFLADDLGGTARPIDDAELQRWMHDHPAQFTRPTRVSFVHVFAADGPQPLTKLRDKLTPGIDGAAAQPPSLGDPFALGRRAVEVPLDAVKQSYGEAFAQAAATLPLGEWSLPLQSRYGWHVIKVLARRDGGTATLDEVRGDVRQAVAQARKTQALHQLLTSLRQRYRVVDDKGGDAPVAAAPEND